MLSEILGERVFDSDRKKLTFVDSLRKDCEKWLEENTRDENGDRYYILLINRYTERWYNCLSKYLLDNNIIEDEAQLILDVVHLGKYRVRLSMDCARRSRKYEKLFSIIADKNDDIHKRVAYLCSNSVITLDRKILMKSEYFELLKCIEEDDVDCYISDIKEFCEKEFKKLS